MPELLAVVDSLESVTDEKVSMRDLYHEKDGLFYLAVREVNMNGSRYALEDISGLKSTIADLKDEKDKVRKQYETLKEEKGALSSRLEELSQIDPTSEAEKLAEEKAKERIAEVERKIAELEAEKDGEISKLRGQLTRTERDSRIESLMDEIRVRPKMRPMARAYLERFVELRPNDDGNLQPAVIDERGKVRVSPKSNRTGPMELVELGEEFASNFPDAIEASNPRGHQTPSSGTTTGGYAAANYEELRENPEKRKAFIEAHGGEDGGGYEAYQKLAVEDAQRKAQRVSKPKDS